MGAGKYRKRPVEVEAMQLDGTNATEVAEWCGGEVHKRTSVCVPTMHGDIAAHPTDWVIRGIVDFYPMTSDQFTRAFDPIDVEDPLVTGIVRLTREAYGNDLPVV